MSARTGLDAASSAWVMPSTSLPRSSRTSSVRPEEDDGRCRAHDAGHDDDEQGLRFVIVISSFPPVRALVCDVDRDQARHLSDRQALWVPWVSQLACPSLE